jgi:hypothetical protein
MGRKGSGYTWLLRQHRRKDRVAEAGLPRPLNIHQTGGARPRHSHQHAAPPAAVAMLPPSFVTASAMRNASTGAHDASRNTLGGCSSPSFSSSRRQLWYTSRFCGQ